RIDADGGDLVAAPRGDADEALVVTEIEVGLGPVIGDIDLAMLRRAHRARVDVEIGVELAQPDAEAPRLQQRAECRCRDALAERGDHAAGDKDIPRHGLALMKQRSASRKDEPSGRAKNSDERSLRLWSPQPRQSSARYW